MQNIKDFFFVCEQDLYDMKISTAFEDVLVWNIGRDGMFL